MFEWKALGASWPSEQAYRVLELLKQQHIRCRMPSDDMHFVSPFHLPHPDLRWSIRVRRRDWHRAMALLEREGLVNGATLSDRAGAEVADTMPASPAVDGRRIPRGIARSGCPGLRPPARRAPV